MTTALPAIPVEIEIKLTGASTAFNQLQADLRSQLLPPEIKTRESRVQIYFDTADLALFAADIELRQRTLEEGDGQLRQTFKHLAAPLTANGLFERVELMRDRKARGALLKGLERLLPSRLTKKARLQSRLRTEFERQKCRIGLPDNVVVELAFDKGSLVVLERGREHRESFEQIELELKAGDRGAMVALSQRLQDQYDIKPVYFTKPEQGWIMAYERGLLSRLARKRIANKMEERALLSHPKLSVAA